MRDEWLWWALGAGALVLLGGAAVLIEDTYVNGQKTGTIKTTTIDGKPVELETARRFLAMRDAAAKDGITLKISSGFRTMAEQQRLWAEHEAGTLTTPVAHPGFSRHQNGIAIDIPVEGNNPNSPTYRWLAANAARFGFVNTGRNFSSPEWWHWERVA